MQSNRKGRRRLCSIVLTAAMVFAALPMTAFTANAETALNCRHEHDDSCYEEDPTATGSDSKKLVCRHEHDESCFEEVIFDGGTSVASPSELFNMRPKTMTGAEELAARINSWADGNGIEARADGDKVIVTGQAVSDKSLRLAIPENVTVEWKAVLESSARYVVHILDTADPNAEFHMAGGAITSLSTEDESAAIYNGDDDTDIVVSGGSITAGDNGKDKPASYGIRNNTDNRITVSGGVISGGDGSGSYGLSNTLGTIIIKGGTVTGGPGINSGIHCENGRIEISGGTVSGGSGDDSFGIYNLDSSVIISGGKVINSGGYAIASIFIQNADKAVIRIDGSSLIFGQDPAELGSTIGQTTNSSVIPTVGGNAAVITWTGSKAEYVNGTAEDLIVSPETVTAKWSQQGGKDGIAYEAGGANKGFIEVPGVTVGTEVKRLAAIAVTNGPVKTVYTEGESFDSTGMTVTANYSDGSKKPVTGYTVTPSGALTVNDSSVTVTYTEGGITRTAVQKITVKATAVYYKITFHANGGSVTPAAGTTGKDGKLKSLPIPTRSGNYRFDGWFSEENGGTQITTDTVFKEDSTIYAHWSDTGGIVLDSIAVTTGPAKTVYTEGESFDSTGMTVTANYKDGSKIPVTGYTVTPSGALTVNDSSVTVTYTEGGITRTAVQKITVKATAVYYKITFHANGGSVTPAAGTTGKDGKLKSLPIPTRSGNYRFDGWFSEENGGTQVTTDTVFKEDSTIYAHWTYTGGTGGSGGGTGGTGGTGGGTGGSGGGTGGSKGSVSASDRLKESLPPDYTGETQIINNVRVPSYVEEVSWIAMEDGRWRIGRADGSYYVNTWVAAYNPYADLSAKQSAFDWFFADMDGYMDTGWYTDSSGSTYYLNPLSDNTMGRMMTGWVLIDGKHYYFNEKADGTRGKLCRNTFTPDGYYVDEHGVWVQQ